MKHSLILTNVLQCAYIAFICWCAHKS